MTKRGIDSYFKKACSQDVTSPNSNISTNNGDKDFPPVVNHSETQVNDQNHHSQEMPRIDEDSSDMVLERDSGIRKMIWDYPTNKKDEVRRFYLRHGPYQIDPKEFRKVEKFGRKFLPSWYNQFRDWLEYSPSKDAAYCLPCYLFALPSGVRGTKTFVMEGCTTWKKVNEGKNRPRSLARSGDTRWSSHLKSLLNLLALYDSALVVLTGTINDKSATNRSTTDNAKYAMMTFEFVFILHFLVELLGKDDGLCRTLQCKSQDILNAMDAISNTKEAIQNFREKGWDEFFGNVKIFCEKRNIEIPDMTSPRRLRGRFENVTCNHYYQVDIFNGTIDCILQEMRLRFNEDSVELLKLSSALDPKGEYILFNIGDICKLVQKFYPKDLSSLEKTQLKYQLELFECDIQKNGQLQHASSLSNLCEIMTKMGKSINFFLIDRLIRLILTLPVSMATSERAFSGMKIVKTR